MPFRDASKRIVLPWSGATLNALAMAAALGATSVGCCKAVPDLTAGQQDEAEAIDTRQLPIVANPAPLVDAPIVRIDGDQVTVDRVPGGRSDRPRA